MASPSQLSGWAGRMLESLEETGVSTGRVVTWLQNNLYRINNALKTGFYTEDGYILPEMTMGESGIYEQMYFCDFYMKKGSAALGAFAYDWTEIQGDKQGSVRRVSKNEVAKTYQQYAKECKADLKELISWYEEQSQIFLGQVLFSDRGGGFDAGLMDYHQPPTHLFENSTIWVN